MNQYSELTSRQQKEVNALPIKFAFSQKQFEEGMRALGLSPEQTDQVYKLGGIGGFYLRTDARLIHSTFFRHREELEAAIAADETGDGFIYDMFLYELQNHEYCITHDPEETLDALGMSEEEVLNDPRLLHGFRKAEQLARHE